MKTKTTAMKPQFDLIRKTRSFLLDAVKDVSNDQFNKIPQGFKNNIIWNMGHIIAAQQGLCYVRSNVPIVVDEGYMKLFKPDTKPEGQLSADAIDTLKKLMLPIVDRLETDYRQQSFAAFKPFKNRYGVEIQTIEDALNFLVYHDGVHFGCIMALKKMI
ncbi:DinB family protein [uncultured Cytophaga sp.]|uniref:DinB family protein n=1 Tax=uncultured Cytophaga sp. TaxID=160238 RepID=UPI002626C566|nr:DinB family protein [uncultured Cytophaga sp.]